MKNIYLLNESDSNKDLKGLKPDSTFYDVLIEDECRVYKPDGSLLLVLCKDAINKQNEKIAIECSQKAKITSCNRSAATGKGSLKRNITKGYISNTHKTNYSISPVSVIVGYFDRYSRFPYARETSYLERYPQEWEYLHPFISEVNQCFASQIPDKYAIQSAIAKATHPAWIIKNTAFSTITINRDWQTAIHQDSGDLREGFGVMAYLQKGQLSGGYLVLPRYRVAVKLESRDVLLFDVHEWHGNTEFTKLSPDAERITCVFYYREKLLRCGSPNYELERAKVCRDLGTVYDKTEIEKADKKKARILSSYGIQNTVSDIHPKQRQTKKQHSKVSK